MSVTAAAKEVRSESAHEVETEHAAPTPATEGAAKQEANKKAGVAATERMAKEGAAPEDPAAKVKSLLAAGKAKDALDAILAAPQPGNVVDKLAATDRAKLAAGLDTKSISATERQGIKVVFDHTPDGEVATLTKLLGTRFHFNYVGKDSQGGVDWEPKGLRRSWKVMEALPPSHVEGNNKLLAMLRYQVGTGSLAEGYYDEAGRGGSMAYGYDPNHIEDPDKVYSEKKDPMYGANAFDETVRHEVGHAVDAKLGASNKYCIANKAGGDWADYGAANDALATKMVAASAGAISKWADASQKTAMIKALATAMRGRSFTSPGTALTKLSFWSKIDAASQKSLLADPVIEAIKTNNSNQQPWMTSKGGVTLGGRIFQESYEQSWTSYDASARSHKVSMYQFRAPGEWFAEAYAAYYEPPKSSEAKGYKLASVDAATKKWFDTNVDTEAGKGSNAKKDNKATAGGGGAGTGAGGVRAGAGSAGAA